jgi:hypothetical protein
VKVSIVELITHPERHENSVIHVSGYLGKLAAHLYLTKDLADMGDTPSAIRIVAPEREWLIESQCAGSYADLEGLFSKSSSGLFGLTKIFSAFYFAADGLMEACLPIEGK